MVKRLSKLFAATMATSVIAMSTLANPQTLTIATVDNSDMLMMKELSSDFIAQNPNINLNWVTLDERSLRQRITTDMATEGGNYDIVTIGSYEIPIWAKKGWLTHLNALGDNYDTADILPPIRAGLTVDNKLFGAPFYGESSMVMYRTDLFANAGLNMPKAPTWAFIEKAAKATTDVEAGVYGICLRGKAGWGENTTLITSMANSFGARWFDENWKPQFNSEAWAETLNYYVKLMQSYGQRGASKMGFTETLSLFQKGKCAIWIDATVAGAAVINPQESEVAEHVGFAMAPDNGLSKRANWLWTWSLAIPSSSTKSDAAQKFISWATSKSYIALVANKKGWANVPPGTRLSLYENPSYTSVAPFAQITLESINTADPLNPTVQPVPYVGVQFIAIPEYQGIGNAVGEQFSAAVAGEITVEEALEGAQRLTQRAMQNAGYMK